MKKLVFGHVDGVAVEQVTLESSDAAVSIISRGSIVRDWRVDGPNGSIPTVLGFRSVADYVQHSKSHGVIAGRVANRTANSEFCLDGHRWTLTPNEGPHHLHGGSTGLERRIWSMDVDTASEAVHLSYNSPDGEEGYPGNVEFTVSWRLDGPRLICEMRGIPDRPTPINLAQHSYYNLGGGGSVLDHELWIDADRYTPTGPDLIPDGTIQSVEGTHRDFRESRSIGESDPLHIGLDDNLVLREGRDSESEAARVSCQRTGLGLKLWTKEPGIQVFNASKMMIDAPGHDEIFYGRYAGLCLEAQHFPDSLHNPDWPSILRTTENPYFQQLEVEICRL